MAELKAEALVPGLQMLSQWIQGMAKKKVLADYNKENAQILNSDSPEKLAKVMSDQMLKLQSDSYLDPSEAQYLTQSLGQMGNLKEGELKEKMKRENLGQVFDQAVKLSQGQKYINEGKLSDFNKEILPKLNEISDPELKLQMLNLWTKETPKYDEEIVRDGKDFMAYNTISDGKGNSLGGSATPIMTTIQNGKIYHYIDKPEGKTGQMDKGEELSAGTALRFNKARIQYDKEQREEARLNRYMAGSSGSDTTSSLYWDKRINKQVFKKKNGQLVYGDGKPYEGGDKNLSSKLGTADLTAHKYELDNIGYSARDNFNMLLSQVDIDSDPILKKVQDQSILNPGQYNMPAINYFIRKYGNDENIKSIPEFQQMKKYVENYNVLQNTIISSQQPQQVQQAPPDELDVMGIDNMGQKRKTEKEVSRFIQNLMPKFN